jgi:hypothetical protein
MQEHANNLTDNLQILVLCKFNNKLIDDFLNNCLIPTAKTYGTVRIVNKASNDPKELQYWVSVVQRLIYASDVLILITNAMGSNVKWIEDNYMIKSSRLFTPFDSFLTDNGLPKSDLLNLCRPSVLKLTLTKRILRKGKTKIRYWGRIKHAEIEISQPTSNKSKIVSDLIERLKRYKESQLVRLSRKTEFSDYYLDIRRAILCDPEVAASVTYFSAERKLVAPSIKAVTEYLSIMSMWAESKLNLPLSSLLPILKKLDSYRPCSFKDINNFKFAMEEFSNASFGSDIEKKKMMNRITSFAIFFSLSHGLLDCYFFH